MSGSGTIVADAQVKRHASFEISAESLPMSETLVDPTPHCDSALDEHWANNNTDSAGPGGGA